MNNINYKALSTLLVLSAIAAIPSAAKAQYYPSYPSTNSNSNIYLPQSPYPSYEERIRASEQRHQQALDMIWGY